MALTNGKSHTLVVVAGSSCPHRARRIITLCLLIADWLFFVRKGSFRWFDPLLWTLIPYAYLVFGFTRAALDTEFREGQKYP